MYNPYIVDELDFVNFKKWNQGRICNNESDLSSSSTETNETNETITINIEYNLLDQLRYILDHEILIYEHKKKSIYNILFHILDDLFIINPSDYHNYKMRRDVMICTNHKEENCNYPCIYDKSESKCKLSV